MGSRDAKKSDRSGRNAESREGRDDGGRRRGSGRPQRQVLLRAELEWDGDGGGSRKTRGEVGPQVWELTPQILLMESGQTM